MAKRDHEQLAVTVDTEVDGGIQLRDVCGQPRRLQRGERARPCVGLVTHIAASTALYEICITR
jgi:hypothetical protein